MNKKLFPWDPMIDKLSPSLSKRDRLDFVKVPRTELSAPDAEERLYGHSRGYMVIGKFSLQREMLY
jgi:hypothetical protein